MKVRQPALLHKFPITATTVFMKRLLKRHKTVLWGHTKYQHWVKRPQDTTAGQTVYHEFPRMWWPDNFPSTTARQKITMSHCSYIFIPLVMVKVLQQWRLTYNSPSTGELQVPASVKAFFWWALSQLYSFHKRDDWQLGNLCVTI